MRGHVLAVPDGGDRETLCHLAPPACLVGPLGPEWTPAERIMENIIGSAYTFRYWESLNRETITFEKLKTPLTDGRRTYVSPDRSDLYLRDAAGFYTPIGQHRISRFEPPEKQKQTGQPLGIVDIVESDWPAALTPPPAPRSA